MRNFHYSIYFIGLLTIILFSQCMQPEGHDNSKQIVTVQNFNGYKSQEAWGKHLVDVLGCHDCHTPKKMTDRGPVLDSSLLLSGHPSQMPAPDIDRKDFESKGYIVTQDLTAWVGPWGISYASNITSDPTGIGNWQESNFIIALRQGKFKGIPTSRSLLPPMPWEMFKLLTDEELKAIFAYLQTTKPINNVVPQAVPPVLALPQ
jgi:hypothetical protein